MFNSLSSSLLHLLHTIP